MLHGSLRGKDYFEKAFATLSAVGPSVERNSLVPTHEYSSPSLVSVALAFVDHT